MEYTVDYFLDKFEKISERKWGVKKFNVGGVCCAYGHCGLTGHNLCSEPTEVKALTDIFGSYYTVFSINDGGYSKYQQPTPKQRILAALRDVKKMQGSQNTVSKEPDVQASVATVDAQRTERWPNKTSSFTNIIEVVEETSDLILNETI